MLWEEATTVERWLLAGEDPLRRSAIGAALEGLGYAVGEVGPGAAADVPLADGLVVDVPRGGARRARTLVERLRRTAPRGWLPTLVLVDAPAALDHAWAAARPATYLLETPVAAYRLARSLARLSADARLGPGAVATRTRQRVWTSTTSRWKRAFRRASASGRIR